MAAVTAVMAAKEVAGLHLPVAAEAAVTAVMAVMGVVMAEAAEEAAVTAVMAVTMEAEAAVTAAMVAVLIHNMAAELVPEEEAEAETTKPAMVADLVVLESSPFGIILLVRRNWHEI